MHHHLRLISLFFALTLVIAVVLAADSDFAEYEKPTQASFLHADTTNPIQPTPMKFVDALKFWHRFGWRDFYFEYAILTLIATYYTLHTLGQKRNKSLAQSWIQANHPMLNEQFAQVGIPSVDGKFVPLLDDGGSIYESYATGRVGIQRLWVEIRTVSRHDLVAWIVESIGSWFFDWMSSGDEDVVEVTIEPNVEWEGFTWGVVKKGKMRRLRETRYDLGFTKVTESTSLPQTLAILTELPEITDTLFAPNKALLKAIDEANKWFEYFIISDFPEETPKTLEGLRLKNRITLVTKLPKSEEGLLATSNLLEQVILLVDTLIKYKFRPEVSKKLKTARSDAVTRFTKSLAALEETSTPQELAQKRRVEKERAERERVGKLSAEEQRKFIEKEKKAKSIQPLTSTTNNRKSKSPKDISRKA